MKRAWLITWEWCGDHAEKKEKIVNIFHPNVTAEKIRFIVERIYVDSELNLSEKIQYIKNHKFTPYAAYFDKIEGVTWQGRIRCGHNPYLYARLVKNLQITKASSGKESYIWEEKQKLELPKGLKN